MTVSQEHTIAISPVGDIDQHLINTLGMDINRVFGVKTEVLKIIDDLEFAQDPERNQYHSTPILEKLAFLAPQRVIKVLAITKVDLFIPILTFVYGEAQLGGRACIVSLNRLRENLSAVTQQKIFFERVIKEAIHELGHTFNLRHCKDHSCIMHYCRRITDVDRKLDSMCRYCKIFLDDDIKQLVK